MNKPFHLNYRELQEENKLLKEEISTLNGIIMVYDYNAENFPNYCPEEIWKLKTDFECLMKSYSLLKKEYDELKKDFNELHNKWSFYHDDDE